MKKLFRLLMMGCCLSLLSGCIGQTIQEDISIIEGNLNLPNFKGYIDDY